MALDNKKIKEKLNTVQDWELVQDKIKRTFVLENFTSALEFVNKVGELAEESDHHPNILMHDWNKVTVTSTTHSEGGVTDKDIDLAKRINEKT